MKDKIKIGNKIIGQNHPCFIIAEAGVNHNGDIKIAKELVDKALEIGVDSIKFQLFKAELLVTEKTEQVEYSKKNTGSDESYLELLKRIELTEEQHKIMKEYCDKKGIIFLSTPHCGKWSADVLDKIGIPGFKIGSGDLTNLPFLDYVSRLGKPIFLSTGMANLQEVREAVDVIKKNNDQLILLQCTTNYPTLLDKINLRAMLTLKNEFNCLVGFSDHSEGIEASVIAACLNANVIEKHFTLDKKMYGPDHKASAEPDEIEKIMKYSRFIFNNKILSPKQAFEEINKQFGENLKLDNIEKILGSPEKKPYDAELRIAKITRKSIISDKDINKGKLIEKKDLIIKRPGMGLHPRFLEKIIGRKAKEDIKKDTLITFEMLE
ncbi:N-acetylneuraminate synthase family protein [Candidatus Woesearchaeota archaeon]|nr:N-acetylneuraminate synthase family protein [Candidatus Woesearchaeota archaeon]